MCANIDLTRLLFLHLPLPPTCSTPRTSTYMFNIFAFFAPPQKTPHNPGPCRHSRGPSCLCFSSVAASAAVSHSSPPRMTWFPPSSSPRSSSSPSSSTGPLGIGMGECPSEDECEIVYDDDDDEGVRARCFRCYSPSKTNSIPFGGVTIVF